LNNKIISQNTLDGIFAENGINGSVIIFDLNINDYIEYNTERNNLSFLPASTFKILNSLMALETGVISDENEIIKWDGKDRGYDKWNMDHNLRSAIKYSAVWFYQELARRMGKEKIQEFVDSTDYGNKNINGNINSFWLDGELRISPKQQIDFLVKLYKSDLPFLKKYLDIVKDILIVERSENYVLRAKSGWAVRPERQIGWYVGYVEQNENVYFFAVNIDINNNSDAPKREKIAREVLKHIGLL